MQTPEGFGMLLTELEKYKNTPAYQELAKQSRKRTEERGKLTRRRTDARFRLRLGRRDVKQNRDAELAKAFRTGDLAQECAATKQSTARGS